MGAWVSARLAAVGTAAASGGYSQVLARVVRGALALAIGGQGLSLALTTAAFWPVAGSALRLGATVWLTWSLALVAWLARRPLRATIAVATLVVAVAVHVVILGSRDPAAETVQWLMPVTLGLAVVAFAPLRRGVAIAIGVLVPLGLAPIAGDEQRLAYLWLTVTAFAGVAGASVLRTVAARADRESALMRAAVVTATGREASAQADAHVRAMLHDEAIAALRVVREGAVTTQEAASAAARAVRALTQRRAAATAGDVDLVVRLASVRCSSVPTTADLPVRLPVDAEVADVLVDAVRELVRNVDRHARARRARVTATDDAGRVEVVVADDGRGMAGACPGDGLTRSVMGRVASVGGAVQIEDRPGGGTVVRLTWCRPGDGAAPEVPAVDPRAALAVITVPFTVAYVLAGVVRYLDGASTATSVGWVVGLAGWLAVLLTWPGDRLPRGVVVPAAVWVAVGSVVYALSLPPGQPVAAVSWAVGATVGVLNVLLVRGGVGWAIGALAVQLGSGALGAVRYGSGLLAWQSALAALLVPVAMGVFFGLTVAWLGRIAAGHAAARRLAETRAAAESARRRVYDERLAGLHAEVVPFLSQVAAGGADEASMRGRAAELEVVCRDELRLPELLDETVRARLAQVRAHRGVVALQGCAPDADLGRAREALATVLEGLAGLDRLDVVVTLGVGEEPGTARLTVVVRTDETGTCADRLRAIDVPAEELPGAVFVDLQVPSGASPAPEPQSTGPARSTWPSLIAR